MDTSRTSKRLQIALGVILVLLPLHALITTWAASTFGHFDLIRIWKELLLVPIGLWAIWNAYSTDYLKVVSKQRLVQLMVLYGVLTLGLGLLAVNGQQVSRTALIYALIINLRFFAIFIIALLVGMHPFIQSHWKQIVLIPAVAVVGFGLLQQFVLSPDWLRHVGYGSSTIQAFQTVDQKPQYARIQSTLRGANPLGVYLSMIFLACVSFFLIAKKPKWKWGVAVAAVVIVLAGTYSRSAWVGAAGGLGLLLWIHYSSPKAHKIFLLSATVLLFLGIGSILALRSNSILKNTLLHTDNSSMSAESSNAVRRQAMISGAKEVMSEPLGRGPGTAGPASVRNTGHTPRIAENYYIQIGQEVGIIGMSMFIAITLFVGYVLWTQRGDQLALILLVSLVAISIANLLSHAWADDTISLLWWGLAGFALSRDILVSSKSINNKNVTKKHRKANKKTA